jgi:hypothetical protein
VVDDTVRAALQDAWAPDRKAQNAAFDALMRATDEPVAWAYEAWDAALANLVHHDNHNRAIAAQLLCNLAKSDPEARIVAAVPALLELTKDPRFVTARHCLQSLWKVGVAGARQRELLTSGLARRFGECANEKNGTLTRYDIIQSFRKMYDVVGEDSLREQALSLVETEVDPKYRKKYAGLWREPRGG